MTIEFHTWNTPNGRKISVALEEMGLAYKVIPVNISKGEQMAPSFLAISPNNKIPAIVDPDGPGGQARQHFRIRRDPALSRREDRQIPAQAADRADSRAGMADVADGRFRADAGTGASFHRAGERAGPRLWPEALHGGDAHGFTACSIAGWPAMSSSPANCRSRISPFSAGPGAIRATRSIWPTSRTSSAGTRRLMARPATKRGMEAKLD